MLYLCLSIAVCLFFPRKSQHYVSRLIFPFSDGNLYTVMLSLKCYTDQICSVWVSNLDSGFASPTATKMDSTCLLNALFSDQDCSGLLWRDDVFNMIKRINICDNFQYIASEISDYVHILL